MKKITVVLLVLALASASCFAALIQVGPTGRFSGDITDLESFQKIENYEIGADARINLGGFGIAANALFGKTEEGAMLFNTIATVNIRLNLSMLEFDIGAGYMLPVVYDSENGEVTVAGQGVENIMEVLKESEMLLRAAVGVNLGGIGVSADYKIPVSTAIKMIQDKDADIDTIKSGKVSVSVLLNIF